MLNVNAPDVRATAYAVYTLSDDLGKGIGPWLVAVLIKAFGRETAFNLGISLGPKHRATGAYFPKGWGIASSLSKEAKPPLIPGNR